MSRDVQELLRSTVDEPTRPLDTAAVVGKARRQTRLARTGVGLGAVVVLAVVAVVGLPLATGSDHPLEIADRPDRDRAADVPLGDGFTLGEGYVWRSEPGSPDDAGLAFVSEVLGWNDVS
ncbi:MAG: hypothetical protein ABR616_01775, partial [Dermatophilaceae bacterium]